MKIIDLLNRIANGEEAPKKIKYNGVIFENNGCNCYLNEKDKSLSYCVEIPMFLNDEVQIIEEEKKIPEKIEQRLLTDGGLPELKLFVNKQSAELTYVINSIIDYLKSKGE